MKKNKIIIILICFFVMSIRGTCYGLRVPLIMDTGWKETFDSSGLRLYCINALKSSSGLVNDKENAALICVKHSLFKEGKSLIDAIKKMPEAINYIEIDSENFSTQIQELEFIINADDEETIPIIARLLLTHYVRTDDDIRFPGTKINTTQYDVEEAIESAIEKDNALLYDLKNEIKEIITPLKEIPVKIQLLVDRLNNADNLGDTDGNTGSGFNNHQIKINI